MPLSKYFKGKGAQVMRDMIRQYGSKKGKQVFYATVNKQKGDKKKKVLSAVGKHLRKKGH